MKALIDSDTPAYSAAISCEGKEEWVALSRLDKIMENTIRMCGCSSYTLYVSGGHNFRYDIDPSYKGNRGADPEHRAACKKHLIDVWGAIETDGYEADDAVGVAPTEDTMIVGIDKDLLMIPGKHYQWPIVHGPKVVKEEKFWEISEEEGYRRFFTQALVGDTSDNIKGVRQIGPKKSKVLLEECRTEEEMYDVVREQYQDDERLVRNLDLLWLWRNLGITYSIRNDIKQTIQE